MTAPVLVPSAPLAGTPPLVGRGGELSRALGAVQQAASERSLRVVLVRGAEGSGKSRLVEELLGQLGQVDPAVRGQVSRVAFAPGEPLPAFGLDRLVRRALGLPDALTGPALLEALRAALDGPGRLPDADADALRLEYLAFVLGVSAPDFRTARMDARSRWEGAFTELKRLMEQRAARTPWVCILEDAERGDLQTADFLDWALGLRWEAPVALVVTLRNEEAADGAWAGRAERWLKGSAVVDVPLTPLGTTAMAALVHELGVQVAPRRLDAVIEQARGNPLVALELLELVRARKAAGVPAELALPTGLREVMDARLALLPGDAREALRRVACVGPRAAREALVRLWPGTQEVLARAVETLVGQGMLSREPSLVVPGGEDLVFCRTGLYEAALARSTPEEQRAWLQQLEAWAAERLGADAAGWGGAEVQLAGLVVRALSGRGAHEEAGLWLELVARVHLRHQRRTEALRALRAAAESARGVRRSVLLRRIGEEEATSGEVQRALTTLAARLTMPPGTSPSGPLAARVLGLVADRLERWDVLGADEAAVALELARAEALSHIGRSEETRSAFTVLEERLRRLSGGATPHLWVRWARTWSWFLAELLGRPRDAQRVCEQVRARADVKQAGLDTASEALLRAEQVAASRTGDLERARALADAQLELARQRGNLSDEAVVWNARAILHMSVGELEAARRGFGTSAELARSIGFKRREAIALHNLGIALLERGDFAGAREAQQQYMALSALIGNRPAVAYGPASLAAVALAERAWADVDRQLAAARQAAEENAWPFILAWARGLAGRARLMRWMERRDALLLKQARGDLLACLDAVEERGSGWTEELDPGEDYLALAMVALALGSAPGARDALSQGRRLVARSCVVSHAWLDVGEALVEGAPLDAPLSWFVDRGYARAARFITDVAAALRAG